MTLIASLAAGVALALSAAPATIARPTMETTTPGAFTELAARILADADTPEEKRRRLRVINAYMISLFAALELDAEEHGPAPDDLVADLWNDQRAQLAAHFGFPDNPLAIAHHAAVRELTLEWAEEGLDGPRVDRAREERRLVDEAASGTEADLVELADQVAVVAPKAAAWIRRRVGDHDLSARTRSSYTTSLRTAPRPRARRHSRRNGRRGPPARASGSDPSDPEPDPDADLAGDLIAHARARGRGNGGVV